MARSRPIPARPDERRAAARPERFRRYSAELTKAALAERSGKLEPGDMRAGYAAFRSRRK